MFCAEGLSRLLNKAKEDKRIHGVAVARNGPEVTHLFFADDGFLFCHAKLNECQEILRILQLYEAASGQKINMEKSGIFFSSSIREETRVLVRRMLNVHADLRKKNYLGLPIIIGRDNQAVFRLIKEESNRESIAGGVNCYLR